MLTLFHNKQDFQQSDCEIAVLPIGAIEQHGSHLPVGTDILIASEVTRRIAEKLNAYLLPALPFSCSIEHRETKGTVYIKAATLTAIIQDISDSLQYSGFKKLYILSGHGGNWVIKPTVRELNRELKAIDVILISTQAARARSREIMDHSYPPDIHAGEIETSVMKYLYPANVGEVKKVGEQNFYPQDFLDYFDIADLTADGCWGYPECGTAKKGEQWLNLVVEAAMNNILEIETARSKINAKHHFNHTDDSSL